MDPGRDFCALHADRKNPQKAVLRAENTNKQVKFLHLFAGKTQKTHVFMKLYFIQIQYIFKTAQK